MILTGDETWCFIFYPHPKTSLPNGKPKNIQGRKHFAWTNAREKWCWKCFLFDEGMIHYDLIPDKQTVNKKHNVEMLRSHHDNGRTTIGFYSVEMPFTSVSVSTKWLSNKDALPRKNIRLTCPTSHLLIFLRSCCWKLRWKENDL